MSAAPGLLVDLSAAQRPSDAGAAVEQCAAALVALPGVVRALLLDPAAPIPGTLHSRLFGSGLLRWNTAREVRRAAETGSTVYVAFTDSAVPSFVQRLGVPVVTLRAPAGSDEVLRAARDAVAPASDALPRLRVAVVAALAPGASVNAGLVEALAAHCEIDVFSDDSPDAQWLSRLDVTRRGAAGAVMGTALAASYDGVVHLLGTSAADLPVLQSARRVSGVLWLRDVALASLYRAEAADAPELAAVLRRVYAHRAPAPVLEALDRGDASGFDGVAEQRYGLLLTGEVVRVARAVVVRSEQAARRLRLDQGANGPCPPLSVCDGSDVGVAASHLLSLLSSPVDAVGAA